MKKFQHPAVARGNPGGRACGLRRRRRGRDPVLGFDTTPAPIVAPPVTPPGVPVAPTVTAVDPANNATGVGITNKVVTANFSEAMAPIGGASSFTLTCAAPCVNPAGTVSLDATKRIATFAMASGGALAANTTYTATVTGATSLATGLALAVPYVWNSAPARPWQGPSPPP